MSHVKIRQPFPQLFVDRSAGEHLQRQLYALLRDLILGGRLAAGQRLPSSRTLAADTGVSRNTVIAAFEQLLAEGYVTGKVGSGTYVSSELPDAFLDARADVVHRPADGDITPRRNAGLSRRGKSLAALVRPRDPRHRAFTPGLPALDEFPFGVWARLLARPWRRPGKHLLAFGDPAGDPDLRAAIAGYLRAVRALNCDAEQVIVVSGAQHGLDLAARLLLDTDDVALVEEPGYAGVRGALIGAGAQLISVPIDEEGLDIAVGERRGPAARLACVAPSHQYPLGVTMSLSRRLALLDWAARRDAWILEDDYHSEYRYAGRPLAALQGLDTTGRVVYVGSFSKVLFPALRLGYLVVPSDLVGPFRRARAALDEHPSSIAQGALARFIEDGHFAAHIRRTRRLYAARQEALLVAARRHLDGLIELRENDAGMHLIAGLSCDLLRRVSDRAVTAAAAEVDVTALPLSAFYHGQADRQGLVLGYAAVPEDEIEAAVKRLASALVQQSAANIPDRPGRHPMSV